MQTTPEKEYYLTPTFRPYFDIVLEVAERQLAKKQWVGAYDLLEIFNRNWKTAKRLEPSQRRMRSGPRNINSLYTYWERKFIVDDCWTVTDSQGRTLSDEESTEILEAVFQHEGSEERAIYWLGDTPQVRIAIEEPDSSGIAPLDGARLSTIRYEDTGRDVAAEWRQLCQYCNRLLEHSLSRLKHKYTPELYVSRKQVEE